MKKYLRWCFIFSLVLTFVSILTINSYAQNNDSFSNLEAQLGIYAGSSYANYNISDIPVGRVIEATVVDPSKMGGCLKGDRVKLTNLGNGEWTITRLADGSSVKFIAQVEDGVMKVTKTETFGGTITQYNKKQSYMTLKAGIYSPESDDLEDFDTGFNGEVAMGYYLSPNAAVEFGIGYFNTEWSGSGFDGILGSWSEKDEITAIPFTLTLKGIAPFQGGELYGGAGIGLYWVEGETEVNSTLIDVKADDDDVTFGFHVLLGLNIDISQNAFIGVEGKYIWAEAEFEETILGQRVEIDTELDGLIGTINVGFRF